MFRLEETWVVSRGGRPSFTIQSGGENPHRPPALLNSPPVVAFFGNFSEIGILSHIIIITLYFITAQNGIYHCTFYFNTAHFVYHCTLKKTLEKS
jgi:hypothetical protein